MGRIARWIDGLDDARQDQIIKAQGWCLMHLSLGENHCLVGQVGANLDDDDSWKVALCFDGLGSRLGLDRAVQLVKARAAKGNRVNVEPSPEPATVGNDAYQVGAV